MEEYLLLRAEPLLSFLVPTRPFLLLLLLRFLSLLLLMHSLLPHKNPPSFLAMLWAVIHARE